jgi:hypothetical protein
VSPFYERNRFPDLVYTFKLALTHEVAYGRLPQAQRRMAEAADHAIDRVAAYTGLGYLCFYKGDL